VACVAPDLFISAIDWSLLIAATSFACRICFAVATSCALAGSVSASLTNFLIISTSHDGSGEYSSISASTFGFCINWSLKIAIRGWMAQLAFFWFGEVGMKRLLKVAAEMALHVLACNLTRVINITGPQPLIAQSGVGPYRRPTLTPGRDGFA
jgi:hypothetical protein